jgi:hypothetical protein
LERFDHGYALLIGVGQSAYPKWSLPVTVNDAQSLKAVFVDPDRCAYPDDPAHLRLLFDASATRKGILDGLSWLKACADQDSEATILIFYSGHGWLDPATGRYYLIQHDIEPFDLPKSALKADEFTSAIRVIQSRRLLVVIDSCHAQGMATSKDEPEVKLPPGLVATAMPKGLVDVLKQGEGRAVFTSSRGTQRSWVRPDGSLSLYTHHLIEALQGAGSQPGETTIRLSNLMNYLGRTVPESALTLCHAEQVPFFDTAAEDFPVALLCGGKGLPTGGWIGTKRSDGSSPHGVNITGNNNTIGDGNIQVGNISNSSGIAIGSNATSTINQPRTIDTGGGAYIEGNINTGGGDFIGRDKVDQSVHAQTGYGDIHIYTNPPNTKERPFLAPPLPVQGIFGRQDEIDQILQMLSLQESDESILPVALRGLGGIGKTTLAIAIARQPAIQQNFSGGVLWTSLGPKPTLRLLLEGWGRVIGVDLVPERDEQGCADRLRSALHTQQMLIIVDDVWDTRHGSLFMVGGPLCRTLFTTRELPVANTLATQLRTMRVDVLKPDAALALLRRLAPDAVNADEKSAKKLCERLEFLPLGLTLAGRFLANESNVPARMHRLLGELIERRDARLKLVQDEGRLGLDAENPVSLQAILGMSVERLKLTDQDRFAMLSLFGGEPLTWSIAAAKAVWDCPLEEAEETVARFIQRGLIERRGDRYWMHALLADYAGDMMRQRGL